MFVTVIVSMIVILSVIVSMIVIVSIIVIVVMPMIVSMIVAVFIFAILLAGNVDVGAPDDVAIDGRRQEGALRFAERRRVEAMPEVVDPFWEVIREFDLDGGAVDAELDHEIVDALEY
jgi:hypothetical protein